MAGDIRLQERCMSFKQRYYQLHELRATPVARKKDSNLVRKCVGLTVGGFALVNSSESPIHCKKVQIVRLMRNSYLVDVVRDGQTYTFDGSELEAA